MGTFYYAEVDSNGVLCVERLHESGQDEMTARQLAAAYPEVIYFVID